MIEKQIAAVWYAPTKGRRYFTKGCAVNAEATAIILKKYPVEPFEQETGHFYDIRIDEPARFYRLHQRLVRLILKETNRKA